MRPARGRLIQCSAVRSKNKHHGDRCHDDKDDSGDAGERGHTAIDRVSWWDCCMRISTRLSERTCTWASREMSIVNIYRLY